MKHRRIVIGLIVACLMLAIGCKKDDSESANSNNGDSVTGSNSGGGDSKNVVDLAAITGTGDITSVSPTSTPIGEGKKVPDFSFTLQNGTSSSLYSLLKGNNYVMLTFWGDGCGACTANTLSELKSYNLQDFFGKHTESGAGFIMLSIFSQENEYGGNWQSSSMLNQIKNEPILGSFGPSIYDPKPAAGKSLFSAAQAESINGAFFIVNPDGTLGYSPNGDQNGNRPWDWYGPTKYLKAGNTWK